MERWEWFEEGLAVRGSRQPGGIVLLHLAGELDLFGVERIREELERALDLASQEVVIDLRGLTFIDSAGISLLVRLWRLAPQPDQVRLIVDGPCRRALEIARVNAFVLMYRRLEDALAGAPVLEPAA